MTNQPTSPDPPPARDDEYFHQLCENMDVALIATDPEMNIQFWNAAAARMFESEAKRMIGTSIIGIVPHDRRRVAERIVRRAISAGESASFEFQYPNAMGSRRELIVTVSPVMDRDGAPIGASACIRDITRRILLQNELNEGRKMHALGTMAGAIAHHFNNILGGVITSVDFALEQNSPSASARVLRQTSRALVRASRLVNGLLAFSEGEQKAEDFADFTEIINDLADEIDRKREDRGIAFKLNLPALPVLPVPRVQVETILRNIVLNAMEAMPDGGELAMDITLTKRELVTCVSDTGCGLSDESIARIFEPFWSTKRVEEEQRETITGLGLAIAHGLAAVLGGSISVTSEQNKGSRFRISIPRPEGA